MNAAKEKLEIVKSRGEAAPNFLGKNAFELIQEYCTIKNISTLRRGVFVLINYAALTFPVIRVKKRLLGMTWRRQQLHCGLENRSANRRRLTMALFTRDYKELRGAFVRNRFGERAVFDSPEIETWLHWQCGEQRPNMVAWYPHLTRDFMATCAGTAPLVHLRECATPEARRPEWWYLLFPRQSQEGVQYLLDALHVSPLVEGVFYGSEDGCIIVYRGEENPTPNLLTVQEDMRGQLICERADRNPWRSVALIPKVLLAEWDRQRPKWHEARQFLCDQLAKEIKRERAKAEADFNAAVAVSEDGTKIVKANWVVVCDLESRLPNCRFAVNNRFIVYQGEAFRKMKALRPGDGIGFSRQQLKAPVQRFPEEPSAFTPRAVVDLLQSKWALCYISTDSAYFVDCALRQKNMTVYVTAPSLCPSPLPEGGVEVMM